MDQHKSILVVSLPLAALLGVAYLLDLLAGASTSWLFLGGVAALGVLLAGATAAWARRAECLIPLLVFLVLLELLAVADTSPLKPFGRFYAGIKPGMTEADVLRALEREFPPTGPPPRPVVNRRVGPNHLGFILDPKDGRYDAEIVAVDLLAGRVVSKHYYSD
jgi:hypothetical protein